jgi:gas vesicle protein
VKVRRAPKFGAFLAVGGVVGALVTLVVTSQFPVDPSVGFIALFGYLCLFGVPAGVALGGLIALILDRRSSKRAREVVAERETVEPADEPS